MTLRLTQEEFDAIRSGISEKKPAKSLVNDNKYKRQLELIFLSLGIEMTPEFRFHKTRRWMFDWAAEQIMVAVEYEGLPFPGIAKSRHTTIKGFCGDCEKYSEAAILGWCVIRVNAVSVDSGLAHDLIRRAIDSRRIG